MIGSLYIVVSKEDWWTPLYNSPQSQTVKLDKKMLFYSFKYKNNSIY